MHLVFVTSIVPDGTATTGYEVANRAIIDGLRRLGVRVTVLGFVWPGKAPSDPEETIVLGSVDVRTDNASAFQKVEWLGRAMIAGKTFASTKLRIVGEEDIRSALSAIEPFDGYVLNAVQMAGAFPSLFRDKPSIYVAHNVEFLSAQQNAAAASSAFQKILYGREARLLEGIERELCDRAGFVLTLSPEDRQALGLAGRSTAAVLPLIARETLPVYAGTRHIAYDATLIGTWTWAPNKVGLEWFLAKVVPHLPSDFQVAIAGMMPAGIEPPSANIHFAGRVSDATEFVRSGAVVPLTSRAGTGVQLKTIEAFELGLPCVATTSSLRGVAYVPSNCTVCDDPREFAAAMVSSAQERSQTLDGSAFHAEQRDALDSTIGEALSCISRSVGEEAAA